MIKTAKHVEKDSFTINNIIERKKNKQDENKFRAILKIFELYTIRSK